MASLDADLRHIPSLVEMARRASLCVVGVVERNRILDYDYFVVEDEFLQWRNWEWRCVSGECPWLCLGPIVELAVGRPH